MLVMNDDEVADGIEDLQPVAVGLLHTSKEAGIFECDAGMAGDGAQQLVIFDGGRGAAVGETKHADQFAGGPRISAAGAKATSAGYFGRAALSA